MPGGHPGGLHRTHGVRGWRRRDAPTGAVYNLEQPPGLPLLFGIHVEVPLVANEHMFLEGHVDWAGDFHEYFEINNISKAVPVLKSKLNFDGRAGKGNFLTMPSNCAAERRRAPRSRNLRRRTLRSVTARRRSASKAATRCRSGRPSTAHPRNLPLRQARRSDDDVPAPQNEGRTKSTPPTSPTCTSRCPKA